MTTQTTRPVPEYIERIKAYRSRTGATLHDAKKAVDANRDKRWIIQPSRWSFFFVGYCCATFIHIVTCVSPHQAIDNLNEWFSR